MPDDTQLPTTRVLNPFKAEQAPTVGALISIEQQRAVAEVQARMIIARSSPRDPIRCMDLILQDCTRASLAETALYQYARGGSEVSGPSIRLAESIARRWGNIASGIKEVSRRGEYSECLAYAWDLESGYYDERQFQVRHWRDTKKGSYALTDERDIYEIIANMGQRRKRAVLLSVIPGDVVEAAVAQCEQTLKTVADTSPEALKKMAEAFEAIGVSRARIEARCQCHLASIRPAQLVQLRKIYASIKDGVSSPEDWFETPPPRPTRAPVDNPPAEEQTEEEAWVTLTNCDGEPFECPSAAAEEELLAILAQAQKRGDAEIEAALDNNEHLLAEITIPRVAHEFTMLRAYLVRAKEADPYKPEREATKRYRATKAEMAERRRAQTRGANSLPEQPPGSGPLVIDSPGDAIEQLPVQEAEPQRRAEAEQSAQIRRPGPEQNPADGPPVRPATGALSDGNASPNVPPSLGEAESRTQPSQPAQGASLIVEPVYDRYGEIAYRAWFHGALFNALRKDSRDLADLRIAANDEMIQAYFKTISTTSKMAALRERDEILKGLA